MARYYVLPRGPSVCLRLARVRDLAGIEDLFMRQGLFPSQIELARLVRSDPRKQVVITAVALVDSTERILGVGAIQVDALEVHGGTDPEPSRLLVDDELTDGLEELLRNALTARARTLARARAAVVPILAGSGTRFKILEAWAAGIPVVSTTVGAEGLPARHGENVLIADTGPAFAETVSRLLASAALRSRLGAAGRRLLEQEFTWETAWTKLTL